MAQSKDAFIPADQVEVSPRGRKKVLNGDLLDTLRDLPVDQAAVLHSTFGKVSKTDRPKVGAIIRKHWSAVRSDDCRIDYTLEGVPQVRVRR